MALAIVNTILGASMGGLSVLILTKVILTSPSTTPLSSSSYWHLHGGGLSVLILTKVIFKQIHHHRHRHPHHHHDIGTSLQYSVGSSSVKSNILKIFIKIVENNQCSVPVAPCWRWKMEFPHDAQRGPGWHGRFTIIIDQHHQD